MHNPRFTFTPLSDHEKVMQARIKAQRLIALYNDAPPAQKDALFQETKEAWDRAKDMEAELVGFR